MDINNRYHIWLLQHLFLSTFNKELEHFAEAWNQHCIQIRGGASRSPLDMFVWDTMIYGVRGQEFVLDQEELDVFGVDWDSYADGSLMDSHDNNNAFGRRMPSQEELNHVEVESPQDVLTPHEKYQIDLAVSTWIGQVTDEAIVHTWNFGLAQARLLQPAMF
jgi:hypothetical protein